MAIETTYTALRENLASVLNRVTQDQEIVLVKRRGADDVALVPARELAGLMETAYLLRSPDRKTALRTLDLVEATLRDPTQGLGKPEPLRFELAGVGPGESTWSIGSYTK